MSFWYSDMLTEQRWRNTEDKAPETTEGDGKEGSSEGDPRHLDGDGLPVGHWKW